MLGWKKFGPVENTPLSKRPANARCAAGFVTYIVRAAERYPQAAALTYLAQPAPLDELRRRCGEHLDLAFRDRAEAELLPSFDNSLLLESLGALGDRGRGVAVVDAATPRSTRCWSLRRRHIRGLRVESLQPGERRRGPAARSCLDGDRVDRARDELARGGDHADRPPDRRAPITLARARVHLVIDHYGLYGHATPATRPPKAGGCIATGSAPHVWVELSRLPTGSPTQSPVHAAAAGLGSPPSCPARRGRRAVWAATGRTPPAAARNGDVPAAACAICGYVDAGRRYARRARLRRAGRSGYVAQPGAALRLFGSHLSRQRSSSKQVASDPCPCIRVPLPLAVALLAALAAAPARPRRRPYPRPVGAISSSPTRPTAPCDIVGRLIADKLASELVESFVIDNRAGASEQISGAQAVVNAAPGWLLAPGPKTKTAEVAINLALAQGHQLRSRPGSGAESRIAAVVRAPCAGGAARHSGLSPTCRRCWPRPCHLTRCRCLRRHRHHPGISYQPRVAQARDPRQLAACCPTRAPARP